MDLDERLRFTCMKNWVRMGGTWHRFVLTFLYGNPWPSDPNPFPRIRIIGRSPR